MRRPAGLASGGGIGGLFQRLLAGLLAAGVLLAMAVFALAVLLTLLGLGSALGVWWWWKTRHLRRALRDAEARVGGVVIEGEVLPEEPARLPPREPS